MGTVKCPYLRGLSCPSASSCCFLTQVECCQSLLWGTAAARPSWHSHVEKPGQWLGVSSHHQVPRHFGPSLPGQEAGLELEVEPEALRGSREDGGSQGRKGQPPWGGACWAGHESLFPCRPGARAAGQMEQQLPSEIGGAGKGTEARVASTCSH